jgi:hypothetical protein
VIVIKSGISALRGIHLTGPDLWSELLNPQVRPVSAPATPSLLAAR